MDPHTPPPNNTDPALQLQLEINQVAAETLRSSLPPPIGDDTPELRDRNARVAMAKVCAMVPCNAVEADLAACHVAAVAQYKDCLRQAGEYAADPKQAGKCRAQAASMGREARGFLGKFERMQALRTKREANDVTRESAAWTEHCTFGELTHALKTLPPLVPRPPAPPAPAPEKAPERPQLIDYEDWPEEEKQANRLRRRGDEYAILHTMRVQQMRKLGGLPENCDFEPPDPELLDHILNGDSSCLRWADTYEPWVPPAPE